VTQAVHLPYIPDRQIEVYTVPSGRGAAAKFGQRIDYHAGDTISCLLGGATLIQVSADDLLP
jgi:hypothetical protein